MATNAGLPDPDPRDVTAESWLSLPAPSGPSLQPVTRKPVPLRVYAVSEESCGDDISTSPRPDYFELEATKSAASLASRPSDYDQLPLQPDGEEDTLSNAHEGPHGARGKWARHLKAWTPEYFWCLLSIALLVALAVLLSQYNNQPIPEWKLGLTINTAVALLATACRAATVVPVSEGISQLKWNWFARGERRLKDLHVFDQASRGPWGSVHMTVTARGRILSTLAAVILVTGLATSTLTQSAVAYSNRLMPNSSLKATTSSSQSFPIYLDNREAIDSQAYIDRLESIAFQASLNPLGQPWMPLEPSCPTGDCNWPRFNSLAVCVDMSKITDSIDVAMADTSSRVDLIYNATLLNGEVFLTERGGSTAMNMTSLPPIESPLMDYFFPPVRKSIAHDPDSDVLGATFSQFYVIWNNINTDPEDMEHRFRAAELLWNFCVKTYEIRVTQGVSKTESVESHTKIIDSSNTSQSKAPYAPYLTLESPTDDQTFTVADLWEYTRLDLDLRRAFSWPFASSDSTEASYTEMSRSIGLNMFNGLSSNLTAEEVDTKEWSNLEQVAQVIASSMTNFIRSQDTVESGDALSSVTFVTVRWEWLSFLAAQIGLTIVFLLSVVIHTARLDVDVVKSSNLAELFAIGGGSKSQAEGAGYGFNASTTGLNATVDDGVVGQLQRNHGRWNLAIERRHHPPPKARVQGTLNLRKRRKTSRQGM